MLGKPDFEQNYWPRTTISVYKKGHCSIRLMKWLIYFDRSFYDNKKNFD